MLRQGGHILFVRGPDAEHIEGHTTEQEDLDNVSNLFKVHVEYDYESDPTLERNKCCSTQDCCDGSSHEYFDYGGIWNTDKDECCVVGNYVDDQGEVIMKGPYPWTQTYWIYDADGNQKQITETGETMVVDGCCLDHEHYCP